MTDRPGLDFSFSGLKTYALNTIRAHDREARADIARAFQDAVVDTLAIKCRRALEQTGIRRLVVAGGVGANKALRERLRQEAQSLGAAVYYPRLELCTDNGAMVAYAGFCRLRAGERSGLDFSPTARWPLEQLREPGVGA